VWSSSTSADHPERRAVRLVRVAGSVVLALFVLGMAIGPSAPVTANPPGFATPVVGIELAASPAEVWGVIGAPGAPARPAAVRRMRAALALDMLFLLAYPTLSVGIARLLGARGRLGRGAVLAVTALAVVMAFGDALENREILALTGLTDGDAMGPALARLRAFTLLKWDALFAAAAILAWGAWRERDWWRWSGAFFATTAALGAIGQAHPPAIEWSMAPLGVAWTMSWIRALRYAPGSI
jgi:hypothetical protein